MSGRRGIGGRRAMGGRHRAPGPPAYVPTLTDIVYPAPVPTPAPAHSAESAKDGRAAAEDLQALMVQRVLEHVNLDLDSRLQEVTAQLVRQHVSAMLPRLADDIERVIRASVANAFERASAELPMPQPPATREKKPPVA